MIDPLVTTRTILDEVFGAYRGASFEVRLWNGSTWKPSGGAGPPLFAFVLRHPGALRRMLLPGTETGLAEAYVYDDIDIEGNLEDAFPLAEFLLAQVPTVRTRLRVVRSLLKLPAAHRPAAGRLPARTRGRLHSLERDRTAVRYHYDTSNDFFALWLGRRMVYSCGYFSTPTDDLDTAQERKLDYICRKLRLRPGERFLDIGCGWGGLVMFAAERYGAEALGITLSKPQADLANRKILEAGLASKCRVEVRDYREMEGAGTFDKIASIGMFEHVGKTMLPRYLARAQMLLCPRGAFLNHGIAIPADEPARPARSFSDRFVFPDGELLPIHMTLQTAASCGLEVRDVECLREHYAMTLRHWVRRLEAHHEDAIRCTDEPTYRVWRLFMSGSAYRFANANLTVFQSLLVKPEGGSSGLPLTRDDWYRQRGG